MSFRILSSVRSAFVRARDETQKVALKRGDTLASPPPVQSGPGAYRVQQGTPSQVTPVEGTPPRGFRAKFRSWFITGKFK
jgi:hypothetical protein